MCFVINSRTGTANRMAAIVAIVTSLTLTVNCGLTLFRPYCYGSRFMPLCMTQHTLAITVKCCEKESCFHIYF